MSERADESVDDVIRQAVALSFEGMQRQELHPPEEAGVSAANAAFRVALNRDAERRSKRKRKPRARGEESSGSANSP